MNLFEQIKKRKDLVSLDIETSGLDHAVDDIWAIGAAKPDGKTRSLFFAPRNDSPEEFKKKLLSIDGLSKKQQEAGIFDPYFKRLDSGALAKQDSVPKKVSKLFNNNSAILIQNVQFENAFLSNAILNKEGAAAPFRENMMYRGHDTSRLFYFPPEVQHQRALATKAYEKFLDGSNEAFGTVTDEYKKMMQAYSDAAAHQNKGAMVVDLMDVSRATYAMAADKGLIDKRFIGIGLSVDFLAKHVLNEKEVHGAVEDATQQLKLFEEMSGIFNELTTGTVSDKTRNVFKSINAAHPRERLQQMVRAVSSAQNEASRAGGYKKMNYKSVHEITTVHGPNGPERVMAYDTELGNRAETRASIFINDPKEAGMHAIQRYKRMGMDEKSLARAQRLIETGESINHLLDDPGISENIDAIATMARNRIKSGKDKAVGWFGKLSTGQKAAAVGTAILAAGYLLTDSSDSKQKIEDLKQKEKQIKSRMYTDSTLKMYTNIPNYHGSGFADWNDRTKHHEY